MNGISYGTSNRGMPCFSASSTTALGTRLCSKPVPTPRPATSCFASRFTKWRCRAAPVSRKPVVKSSSPPESHGVGSSSSEMWTQRIGRSPPSVPAMSSRPQSETRSPTVSIPRSLLDALPGLGEHRAEHVLDLLELLRVADEGGRELDHRVAAIVRPADQAPPEELPGEIAPEEPFRLLVGEALLGLLVLDQLDGVEEPGAAHVPDDGDVAKPVEHGPELALLAQHVAADVLALEDVEVGQRDGRRDGMAREREAVGEHLGAVHER